MKTISIIFKNPLSKAVFVLVFCSALFYMCNVSTANLSNVVVCTSISSSGACESGSSAFPADVPKIYCSADLKNAPSETKVTFTWKYNGEKIASTDVSAGSAIIYSSLTPNGTLPAGNYSVTVKINSDNSEPVTKEFKVE